MDNSYKLLQGKVALVTGAADGIGRNHAMMLASRGATVIALDLDREAVAETAKAIGGECLAVAADVTDIPALQAAIAEAATKIGPIDILVNNAGIGGQGLAIEDIDETTFDAMVAVNMKGSFFATQAVVPAMKERRYGKVISISSNFAMGGAAFASHYAACKSAL